MGFIDPYCMCTESMHRDQSAALLVEVRSFSEKFYRLLIMYDSFWGHLKYTMKSFSKLSKKKQVQLKIYFIYKTQ